LSDPYEWRAAAGAAVVVFIASLALAPVLTPGQKNVAAEINHKTLKAAAAIKGLR
jgi:hypothetical protein